MSNEKKSPPVFHQKALERTRKNIGNLSDAEATSMMKKLGGEIGIGVESENALKKKHSTAKVINRSDRKQKSDSEKADKNSTESSADEKKSLSSTRIPILSQSQKTAFMKLYSSSDHKIISIFDYILYHIAKSDEVERVSRKFINSTLSSHLAHVDNFNFSIIKIIELLPVNIQLLIEKDDRLYMKVFRTVKKAPLKKIHGEFKLLQQQNISLSVSLLSPFIKTLYEYLIKLMFLADANMIFALESAGNEFEKYTHNTAKELKRFIKEAQREWKFVYHDVIKGLYPLLMRFSSTECVSVNSFFTSHTGKILSFLEVTRFDLILPEKIVGTQTSLDAMDNEKLQMKFPDEPQQVQDESATEKQDVLENQEDDEIKKIVKKKQAIEEARHKSIAFADRMFPNAGWNGLEDFPDFYPYFQELLDMPEGFNLIDHYNPMQVIAVLVHIIEDLLGGAHKIDFFLQDTSSTIDTEDFEKLIQNWYLIRVTLLEGKYYSLLSDYVNNIYSNKDFRETPYGRKKLAAILWYQQTLFLPYLKFDLNYMDNETQKKSSQAVFMQVAQLTAIFTEFSTQIDAILQKSEGNPEGRIRGVINPWSPYVFSIQNVASRRLSILLGGKKSSHLTNANLIKAITCYLQILHWWINDSRSPAYKMNADLPYRRDTVGDPVFTIPLRNDV
ncbi:MAG: hypothetical protein ACRC5H_08975, partial [Treponemataceae bacterium]